MRKIPASEEAGYSNRRVYQTTSTESDGLWIFQSGAATHALLMSETFCVPQLPIASFNSPIGRLALPEFTPYGLEEVS
jgi:hypothetical protein